MGFVSFLRGNANWLASGALLTFSSSYGQTFFISIFAGEIRQDFGLSHGAWGATYTIATLVSALVMVWAGALTDRIRVRSLAPWILVLLAAACGLMSIAQSVLFLGLTIFLLRFAGQGMASHIATVSMARWFVATRGRALSVATLGYAIGEAALPLIFVALMVFAPWRSLWLLAALLALIAIPILLRLLRHERTPQSVSAETEVAGMDGHHWTRRAALRNPLFWAMVPIIVGPSAFVTAFFFQQVHLAQVKGWQHFELVALFPIFTASSVVTMVASGFATDRFGTARLVPLFQIPIALSFVAFAGVTSLLGAVPAIILMGVTVGMNATVPAAFWTEFYGSRHIGAIKALATAVMVLGSALGPGLSGWLIDRGTSFDQQMPYISIWFLAASAIAALAVVKASKRLAVAA